MSRLPCILPFLILSVLLSGLARGEPGAPFLHSGSSSQYVHSNDTIQVYLNPQGQLNQLYGPSGSVHELEFVVSNLYRGGHFSFSQTSEDGFLGSINAIGGAYLEEGESKTIKVSNMKVPERQEGARIMYTFTVCTRYIMHSLD